MVRTSRICLLVSVICLLGKNIHIHAMQDYSPYCADLVKITSLCNEVFIHILCPQTCHLESQDKKKPCGISKYDDTGFGFQRKKRNDNDEKEPLEKKLEKDVRKDIKIKHPKDVNIDDFPIRHRVRRIVGGTVSKRGAFPWHVALYFQGDQICSGAILTPEWVVTTAHCFDKDTSSYNEADWLIVAGDHSLYNTEGSEQIRNVKKILIHERNYKYWKVGYKNVPDDYDIALLKLKRPLQLDTYANVVCLPGIHDNFKSADICKVMGWGATKAQGSRHDLLHEANVKLVPRDICNLPLSYNGTVHERALCAGYKSIKTDACEFDSGGSMACRKGKNWAVLGLISWGFQCGKPNDYGVYTNIPLMKRWIIEMILSYDDKTNSIISIFERIANIAGASAMHFQVPAVKLNKPNKQLL